MTRTKVFTSCIVASCLVVLAGCGFAPSDPKQAPLALRVDDGVITVIVPECGDDRVVAASVYDYNSSSLGDPTWRSEEFVGVRDEGIALGSSDWVKVAGSYSGLASIGIEIKSDRRTYGGSATAEDLTKASGLPNGQFFLNGKIVEFANYQDAVSRYPCTSSTGAR